MQFVDLAMMANTAAGWNDLEALPKNGFGLCLQERTGVDISRILSIRTSIEPRTPWPCAAIVKAARNWTGRDQTGRTLRDPGDWLYQQAFYIATEGMHKEWEAYSVERDKRMAEARGPEAVQVQALLDGLAGKMRMPPDRSPGQAPGLGMSPEARAAWKEERDKP